MSITFDEFLDKNSYATFTHYELKKHDAQVRAAVIEECKEKVREHWLNGTVAHRIAEEIYASLDQLKEKT